MVSVGRILEGAFALIREHYVAVAIWAGIYLAGNIAVLLAMAPMMQSLTDPTSAGDPTAMLGAMGPVWLLNILLGLVGIVLYAAAMRAVLRPQDGGVGFLRVGMDELRLLGLLILFTIGGGVVGVGLTFGLSLLGAGLAFGAQSPLLAALLAFLLGIGLFLLFVFLLVRLSLAFPLTLHRRRIVIGEAWTLSKGRFWTLFGAALVITLIGFMLAMVAASFAMGSYFTDLMSASGDPEAMAMLAERQAERAGTLSVAMILQTLAGSVVGALWIALSGGSIATAARLMLDEEFDDAEEVFG